MALGFRHGPGTAKIPNSTWSLATRFELAGVYSRLNSTSGRRYGRVFASEEDDNAATGWHAPVQLRAAKHGIVPVPGAASDKAWRYRQLFTGRLARPVNLSESRD